MLETSKYSAIKYLKRAVSNTVPEPITLDFGNPDTCATTYAIKSTGLLAIINTPLNPLAITCSVISFTIFVFATANSSLDCPGFCGNPAVITTILASLHSE